MIRFITLSFIISLTNSIFGQAPESLNSMEIQFYKNTDNAVEQECISECIPIDLVPHNMPKYMIDSYMNNHIKLVSQNNRTTLYESEKTTDSKTVEIETSDYGQVKELLEKNEGNSANILILSGPIDASDFKSIWACALKGNLKILDISNTKIKDNIIPDYALYDTLQFSAGHWLGIREIKLPDEIISIGKAAFAFMLLEQINIPSSLKELGSTAFGYDYMLDCPLRIPEGVKEIKYQTFYNCMNLKSSPVLPNSLKKIGQHVFVNTFFPEIELNYGLEIIEEGAFQSCGLKYVKIPDSIIEIGPMAFQLCEKLEEIFFPTTIETIPRGLFSYCNGLKSVSIPSSCKVIEDNAFMWCTYLNHVTFPQNLKKIGKNAFNGCALNTIVLPSDMKSLGSGCFSIYDLQTIYCEASTPPICEIENGKGPFDEVWASGATLYVPIGSKTKYMDQQGWNIITNIEETSDFPSAGLGSIKDNPLENETVFDITGRKVVQPLPNHVYVKKGKKFIQR